MKLNFKEAKLGGRVREKRCKTRQIPGEKISDKLFSKGSDIAQTFMRGTYFISNLITSHYLDITQTLRKAICCQSRRFVLIASKQLTVPLKEV